MGEEEEDGGLTGSQTPGTVAAAGARQGPEQWLQLSGTPVTSLPFTCSPETQGLPPLCTAPAGEEELRPHHSPARSLPGALLPRGN